MLAVFLVMKSRLLSALFVCVTFASVAEASPFSLRSRRSPAAGSVPWTKSIRANLPSRFWLDTISATNAKSWAKGDRLETPSVVAAMSTLHAQIESEVARELGSPARVHFLSLRVFPLGRGHGTLFAFDAQKRTLTVNGHEPQNRGVHTDPGNPNCAVKVCVIPDPADETGRLLVANHAQLGTAYHLQATRDNPLTHNAGTNEIFLFLSKFGANQLDGTALWHSAPNSEPPRDQAGAELQRILIHGGVVVD